MSFKVPVTLIMVARVGDVSFTVATFQPGDVYKFSPTSACDRKNLCLPWSFICGNILPTQSF